MTLRLKIFLTCFVLTILMGISSSFLFAKSWRDLARAYGILTLSVSLERLATNNFTSELTDWAFEVDMASQKPMETLNWVKKPIGFTEKAFTELATKTIDKIRVTKLDKGAFETPIGVGESTLLYLIAFNKKTSSDDSKRFHAAGTQALLSLWALSPLAAPFLSIFAVALILAALVSYIISTGLNQAYQQLERAMEDVGAGRFQNLKISMGGDRSVRKLKTSLVKMATLLEQKETMITETSNLAFNDPMTGISNYRAFEKHIKRVMEKAPSADNFPTLAIVDLDFFKKINDTYGHQVGDYVLKETAKILKSVVVGVDKGDTNVELKDFVGRYGGEEFVGIFLNCKKNDFYQKPCKILQLIKTTKLRIPETITSDKKAFDLSISASIGIAPLNMSIKSKDEWIKIADDALYVAKKGGRGRVVWVDSKEEKHWT